MLLLALLGTSVAMAQTHTWTNAAPSGHQFIWGGQQQRDNNWTPIGTPNGVGHTAIFANTGLINGNTVTLGSNITVGTLQIQNTNGITFTIAPNTFNFTFQAVSSGSGTSNLTLTSANTSNPIISVPITLAANNNMGVSNAGSGTLTLGGSITTVGQTITFSNSGSGGTIVSGAITGTGNLTKSGSGTLTLSGNNTYTGTTTIQAGQVTLSGTHTGTGQINIAGGTLLLGAADRIGNSTPIQLSGGTLNTGGNSDVVGSLTLSANSTIDMGSGSSILTFAGASYTGGTLTVSNWSGSMSGGGTDRIIFTNSSGLSQAFLSNIYWANQNITGAKLIGSEIVPIPEPAAYFGAALLLGAVLVHSIRRRTTPPPHGAGGAAMCSSSSLTQAPAARSKNQRGELEPSS
jgi:autotransporter-associated beta strand protein